MLCCVVLSCVCVVLCCVVLKLLFDVEGGFTKVERLVLSLVDGKLQLVSFFNFSILVHS